MRILTPALALAAAAAWPLAPQARDVADPGEIAACRAIVDPVERAGCYDQLFGGPEGDAQATPAPTVTDDSAANLERDAKKADAPTREHTDMAIRWELDPGTNRGLWLPRGHYRTYVLPARWTSDVNEAPVSPTEPAATAGGPIDAIEAKFQISLKFKAADDMFGTKADLWLGYTQQSNWQVYNGELSRPFRETNYEPEVFTTIPVKFALLGLTGRMINLGLLHESNGQSDPRSRSWNRVYAQVGLERGAFSLLVRPWVRINESARNDNNPDITSYIGRGDILGIWTHGDQTVSLMLRDSFEGAWRGAGQLDYSFPIVGNLKGYLQIFSGYGESLIDYNHRQTTVGLGVLVIDLL